MKEKYLCFTLNVELKEDIPENIVPTLFDCIKGRIKESVIDHPFFKIRRWYWFLKPAFHRRNFTKIPYVLIKKKPKSEAYLFTTTVIINNHDGIVEKFFDFILPYIQTEGYIGDYLEEGMEEPYFLYIQDGILCFKDPSESDLYEFEELYEFED